MTEGGGFLDDRMVLLVARVVRHRRRGCPIDLPSEEYHVLLQHLLPRQELLALLADDAAELPQPLEVHSARGHLWGKGGRLLLVVEVAVGVAVRRGEVMLLLLELLLADLKELLRELILVLVHWKEE